MYLISKSTDDELAFLPPTGCLWLTALSLPGNARTALLAPRRAHAKAPGLIRRSACLLVSRSGFRVQNRDPAKREAASAGAGPGRAAHAALRGRGRRRRLAGQRVGVRRGRGGPLPRGRRACGGECARARASWPRPTAAGPATSSNVRLRDMPRHAALRAQLRLARRAGSAAGGGGADAGVSEQVKHLYVFAAAKAGMRQSDEERKRYDSTHCPLDGAPRAAPLAVRAGRRVPGLRWRRADEALTLCGLVQHQRGNPRDEQGLGALQERAEARRAGALSRLDARFLRAPSRL